MATPSSRACVLRRRFFGKGQFVPDGAISATPHMYSDRRSKRPTSAARAEREPETWGPTRAQRRQSEVSGSSSPQRSTDANGFAVRMRAEGTADVALAVEICFRRVDASRLSSASRDAVHYSLPAGIATYRTVANQIDSAPGTRPTSYVQLRGRRAEASGDRSTSRVHAVRSNGGVRVPVLSVRKGAGRRHRISTGATAANGSNEKFSDP